MQPVSRVPDCASPPCQLPVWCLSRQSLRGSPCGRLKHFTTLFQQPFIFYTMPLFRRHIEEPTVTVLSVVPQISPPILLVSFIYKRPENVIMHTDRVGQYCSAAYQALRKRHLLRESMSARGTCYDNAWTESFFHSVKVECIYGERFASHEIMQEAAFKITIAGATTVPVVVSARNSSKPDPCTGASPHYVGRIIYLLSVIGWSHRVSKWRLVNLNSYVCCNYVGMFNDVSFPDTIIM